jgi:hypothetical protein
MKADDRVAEPEALRARLRAEVHAIITSGEVIALAMDEMLGSGKLTLGLPPDETVNEIMGMQAFWDFIHAGVRAELVKRGWPPEAVAELMFTGDWKSAWTQWFADAWGGRA